MKRLIVLLSLLIPLIAYSQCAGNQSFTLTPAPIANTYQSGSAVTMSYTMQNWNGTGFGANWLEGFGLTLGPGWVSVIPTSAPTDCNGGNAGEGWLWMTSSTSASTGTTAGPGYFYEGPTGPLDGDPGNDWGDFGTTCSWTFSVQLTVSDDCDPQSLSIEVTPYADGTMGSWGNEACFDGPFQVFSGTVAGGTVNTSPISITTDTICTNKTLVYSVVSTPGSTYDWQISGGGVLSEDESNVAHVFWTTPGTHIISVQETTVDSCIGEVIDTTIEVIEPILNLGMPYATCPNSEINLFTSFPGGDWSGLNMSGSTFSAFEPGTYYPTYTVNIFGCIVTDSIIVEVMQPLISENIVNSGTFLDFCRRSRLQSYLMSNIPGVQYIWHVDGQLVNANDSETMTNFELTIDWPDSTMTHQIEVYGIDSAGCVGATSYLTITTKECNRLYAPNSFTPNGDSYNDAFVIRGMGIYDPLLKIYNRWGQIIYTTNSLGPWNGNDGNGYFCQNGVYSWTLHYIDDMGFNRFEQGHINLIR